MNDREPLDDGRANHPVRRVPTAVLVGIGGFVALTVSLFAFRHLRCVENAIEEARAAGFVLDVRRTWAAEAEANRRATALYAAIDRMRRIPEFDGLAAKWRVSLRIPDNLDSNSELRSALLSPSTLFQELDRIPPSPPIDPSGIDLLRSTAVATIHLLSAAAHVYFTTGDRAGAERAVARLFSISVALRGSADAWNARLRLIATQEATKRVLEMIVAQEEPESWVDEILRDDGAGAWRDYHECELTRMLEATDPVLVGSTISTRTLPQIEFNTVWERLIWPERLSSLISLGAHCRTLVDSEAPDALEQIRDLEENMPKWVMPTVSNPYSPQLDYEIRARSDVALARAAARVLGRLRLADFDTVDLADLVKDLPIDVETRLPFRVLREADTILVQNATNTRSYRVVRKDVVGK